MATALSQVACSSRVICTSEPGGSGVACERVPGAAATRFAHAEAQRKWCRFCQKLLYRRSCETWAAGTSAAKDEPPHSSTPASTKAAVVVRMSGLYDRRTLLL